MMRSGPEGYGWVSKLLHWTTVLLVATQLAVGYTLDLDEGCDPPEEDRSGGDTSDAFEDRLDRIEDLCEERADRMVLLDGGFDMAEVHLALGLAVLVIGLLRILWRRVDGFPPWSERLSSGERTLVHWTERTLLSLLLVVPATGIVLVLTGDDDWVPLHVAAHVAFFATLAAHLWTNLRPAVLRRMLPAGR